MTTSAITKTTADNGQRSVITQAFQACVPNESVFQHSYQLKNCQTVAKGKWINNLHCEHVQTFKHLLDHMIR